MKRKLFIILTFSLLNLPPAFSKKETVEYSIRQLAPSANVRPEDQIQSYIFPDVVIWGRYAGAQKKERRKLDRMVVAVKKTYPYSLEIKGILIETYLYMQTLKNQEERDKYIKEVEKGVWKQYLPEMKKLTLFQGKMLIKLIDRECNQTSYELIKAFMGPFKSGFYQMFAGLFGATLKKEYDPENCEEDSIIEEIIEMIENGEL